MKAFKKTSFTVLLFLITLIVNSQTIKIEGSLNDSITKSPVPYSNVLILNSNDSIIEGDVTGEKGKFKIEVKKQKGLLLKTRSLGYLEKIIELDFNDNQNKIELEIFLKRDTTLLKEVSVSAQNQVITKFDRKVYKINEGKKAAARDIFDLLRTLPGVTVDAENNVTYKGTSPEIMVDDMPAKYIYPDIAMIPIDNVEKIELIDASMRSGGNGTGGIINIKMKKETTDGFSGASRMRSGITEKGDRTFSNGFLNMNYKKKKILVYNNVWFYDSHNVNESVTDGIMNYNNTEYSTYKTNNSDNNWNYLSEYLGMQIQFNDKTKLMLSGGISGNSSISESNSVNTINNSNGIYQKYTYNSEGDYQSISSYANAYFRHTFDTTLRELSAYFGYNFPAFKNDNHSSSTYNLLYNNGSPSNIIDNYTSVSDISNSNYYYGLYYNHPINEKTRWNVNYRGNQRNVLNYDVYKELNDLPLTRENFSHNGFTRSQSLSLRFGSKFGKWKIDGGIKQELEIIKMDFNHKTNELKDTLIKLDKIFYNIEPSLNIFYEIDSIQDLKVTFSRTVRTPYYAQLNGFIDKASPYNWSAGNPDLEASKYNNIYLSYSYNKPMWNLSTELFYSQTNNARTNITYPLSETLYLTMPENIAFENRIGIDLASFFSFKGGNSINISGSFYHSKYDASFANEVITGTDFSSEDIIKKNYGFDAKISSNIKIAKNTRGMIYAKYNSREISVKGYDYGSLSSYLSITQTFFKRKLQLSFSAGSIFDEFLPNKSYYNYLGREYTKETTYSTWYNRNYSLSIRYRFRYGDRNTGRQGQGQGQGGGGM